MAAVIQLLLVEKVTLVATVTFFSYMHTVLLKEEKICYNMVYYSQLSEIALES